MTTYGWEITPGGLTEQDRDKIFELAGGEKKLTSGQIARAIKKHPGTVGWFMTVNGLRQRADRKAPAPFWRNGVLVRPFSDAEDLLISELRADGKTQTAIAAEIKTRFGHDRSTHSIDVRLKMLAGFEEAQAA